MTGGKARLAELFSASCTILQKTENDPNRRFDRPVLREEEVHMGDDARFEAWFIGSLAREADGAPLRLFHSTAARFSVFNCDRTDKARWNWRDPISAVNSMGAFFAHVPRVSEQYIDLGKGNYKQGGMMIPVYLKMTKPKDYLWFEDIYRDLAAAGGPSGLKARLVADGFDSIRIIDPNSGDVEEHVVFSPAQVRSALAPDRPFDHPALDPRQIRRELGAFPPKPERAPEADESDATTSYGP
jgi:hypothetical protein